MPKWAEFTIGTFETGYKPTAGQSAGRAAKYCTTRAGYLRRMNSPVGRRPTFIVGLFIMRAVEYSAGGLGLIKGLLIPRSRATNGRRHTTDISETARHT